MKCSTIIVRIYICFMQQNYFYFFEPLAVLLQFGAARLLEGMLRNFNFPSSLYILGLQDVDIVGIPSYFALKVHLKGLVPVLGWHTTYSADTSNLLKVFSFSKWQRTVTIPVIILLVIRITVWYISVGDENICLIYDFPPLNYVQAHTFYLMKERTGTRPVLLSINDVALYTMDAQV